MHYEQGPTFMVNQNANPPLSVWAQRIAQLEAALSASGRDQLVVNAMTPMRQLFGAVTSAPGGPPPEAVDLLGRAFAEIKACVVDPTRQPDPALFAHIRSLAGMPDAPSAPTTGINGVNGHAAPAPPPALNAVSHPAGASAEARAGTEQVADPEVDEAASALLTGFASGDDDELSALLDTVGGPAASQPGEQRAKDELGTLREDDGSEGRVFMKGELQPGLLSDLIQLFAQNRETGRLLIESPQGKASLFLTDGQIVDAECGGEVGEKGFYNLMQIREGRFSYQRGTPAQNVRIYRKTQHLIMDTLRLIDESA